MSVTRYWQGDGVLVIGIAGAMQRAEARVRLRLAICEAVAQWLHIAIDGVSVDSQPGQAPRLLLAGRAAWLSISHDDGISLAAMHLHGPVGIDVMRIVDIPDWYALARDYLGPQLAGELAACPADRRALMLAQAWTAREAALKCAGLALTEWHGVTPACRLQAVPMPAAYMATLAY